jgi:hypothetical protein
MGIRKFCCGAVLWNPGDLGGVRPGAGRPLGAVLQPERRVPVVLVLVAGRDRRCHGRWIPTILSCGDFGVSLSVVERAVLEHGDEEAKQAIGDTAESAGVTVALLA